MQFGLLEYVNRGRIGQILFLIFATLICTSAEAGWFSGPCGDYPAGKSLQLTIDSIRSHDDRGDSGRGYGLTSDYQMIVRILDGDTKFLFLEGLSKYRISEIQSLCYEAIGNGT
jgi:hypothetical protein